MKKKLLLINTVIVIAVMAFLYDNFSPFKTKCNDKLLETIVPDTTKIPDNKFGEMVKYGRDLKILKNIPL